MKFLFLILFCSLSIHSVHAEDCAPMDLNVNSPLTKMPLLDQDGMGICYAFAATQLVEFQLLSKGIDRTLSPIDASFMVKANSWFSSFELASGYRGQTIQQILNEGVASRECIDKAIAKHTKGTDISSEQFLKIVEEVYVSRRKKVSPKKIKENLKESCQIYGVAPAAFDKIVQDLNKPFEDYLDDIFSDCDKERKPITGMKYEQVSYLGTDSVMQSKLDQILDKHTPVGVTLCNEILTGKPDHRGLERLIREDLKDNEGNSLCEGHVVLVTARRKVKNKCEYLIRNSVGGNWNERSLTCACRVDKAYYPDCSKNTSKSAKKVMLGCWVKEENLLPNTVSVGGFVK